MSQDRTRLFTTCPAHARTSSIDGTRREANPRPHGEVVRGLVVLRQLAVRGGCVPIPEGRGGSEGALPPRKARVTSRCNRRLATSAGHSQRSIRRTRRVARRNGDGSRAHATVAAEHKSSSVSPLFTADELRSPAAATAENRLEVTQGRETREVQPAHQPAIRGAYEEESTRPSRKAGL
jgi:hypothetical protein